MKRPRVVAIFAPRLERRVGTGAREQNPTEPVFFCISFVLSASSIRSALMKPCWSPSSFLCALLLASMTTSILLLRKNLEHRTKYTELAARSTSLQTSELEVPPCHWFARPAHSMYPRVKRGWEATAANTTKCLLELLQLQQDKQIKWLPHAGTLLQTVAFGGSHGAASDWDIDVRMLSKTHLNRTFLEHCSQPHMLGNYGYSVLQDFNWSTLPDAFRKICRCSFESLIIQCPIDAYEILDVRFGRSWWIPLFSGKSMGDEHKLCWADPRSNCRQSYWIFHGENNLRELSQFDENKNSMIEPLEVMSWLRKYTNSHFNANWYRYELKEEPCRIINGWIDLNHSYWWFQTLDLAFNHTWKVSKIDATDLFVAATYETDQAVCMEIAMSVGMDTLIQDSHVV